MMAFILAHVQGQVFAVTQHTDKLIEAPGRSVTSTGLVPPTYFQQHGGFRSHVSLVCYGPVGLVRNTEGATGPPIVDYLCDG